MLTGMTTVEEQAAVPVDYRPTDANTRHPVAIWFFFWGEFAERCSYYGMRAILPLYLTTTLGFADKTAAPVYSAFKMACYFLPLLGGFIADRYLGKYWTIVGFSVPYVLGHFILGIPSQAALFVALALLAGGSGVIKPNISTLMGLTYDQKRPGQELLRSAAFMWFYLSINVGSLLSMFAIPMIRDRYGYAIAFQFPAWLMVLSLLVFAAGKRHYGVETPGRGEGAALSPEQRRERWRTMWRLFGVFGLFVFFWVGYEHSDSLWVFFARDYVNLNVPWFPRPLAPEQPQTLNPLCVVIFVPLFNWLFKRLDPAARVITARRKIFAGFLFTGVSIAVMAAAGYLVSAAGGKVSVGWLAVAYVLLTLGEILLYGTGLELAYAAAPKDMKGFVTACFLLTNTLGNFVNVWLTPLYGGSLEDPPEKRGPLAPGPFFSMSAAIVLVAGVAFYFTSRRLDTQSPGETAGTT